MKDCGFSYMSHYGTFTRFWLYNFTTELKTNTTRKQRETYTLCSRERHVTELLEEKDACHHWDQIHDEVIVHHTPRIQLQPFQVVRAEMCCQFRAPESCGSQRRVDGGLLRIKPSRGLGGRLVPCDSLAFLFCRMVSARPGWKPPNW